MHLVLLLAAAAVLAPAQSTRTQCSLSAPAEKAVAALPSLNDLSLSWEERIAPRRALAERHPDNWPLQFLVQDAIRRHFHIGREWDRALAFYRRLPDRVLGELLEARLIGSFHRKRSRDILDRLLQTAPNSPWVRLTAAEWAANPIGRDPAFGATHLEEFRRLCPDNPRAFLLLDLVRDAEKLSRHVQDLRSLLQSKKRGTIAEADLLLFRAAWPWEKAAAAASGEAEFQRTVRSDLAAIRALKLYHSADWYTVLRLGYEQMLKNPALLEPLREEIVRNAPKGQLAWWIDEERNRSQPPQGAPREEYERWRAAEEAALRDRLQRFDGQPFTRFSIHRILYDPNGKIENAEVERLADLALRLQERYPDQGSSWPPVQMLIAEVYAKRKVRLDRVPALVQQGLEEVEYQEKHRRDSDAIPNRPGGGLMDTIAMTHSRAREVRLRHALATGETEKANAMLADFRRTLEQSKPANDAAQSAAMWRRDHSTYLELAKLAGLTPSPVAELLPSNPEHGERFPVAGFEAKDLSGRTWRLADLKGKVAYVNVWTTWCSPCRAEMPGLQQLHERWKDRTDRVVLTISADLHEALAREFIRDYKYTFPVLHGAAIAEKFFPPIAFPQNWLIDPQGRRLDMHAPRAYDTTLTQIEQLADKLAPQNSK